MEAIDEVNGYRWAEWSRSPEGCDDQQELDFHSLEKRPLQHVMIDGISSCSRFEPGAASRLDVAGIQ